MDLGCGSAQKLVKVIYPVCQKIVGIDQENIIEYCKKQYHKKGLVFLADDFEKPKRTFNEKFDLILNVNVIEHLVDPDKLLNYIKKHAKKDTYIIITTLDRDIWRGKNCTSSPKPEHVREWTFEAINLICSGVVPQHPPMILAPASIRSLTCPAISSGDSGKIVFPSCRSDRRIRRKSRRPSGSRPDDSSSRISSRGSTISACAIPSRCCIPFE